jgi:hypothetical protein
MKNYLVVILVIVAFGVGYFVLPSKSQPMGSYLVSTVTITSSTIASAATTTIYAAGANLQRVIITNKGNGTINCAFGTPALIGQGLQINAVGSTTATVVDITDPNLLGKLMNCVSTPTTTVSILKY